MKVHQNGKRADLPTRRQLKNESRNMGLYILGGRGTNKSRVEALAIALQDYLAGYPQVIFDVRGTVGSYFLDKLLRTLTHLSKAKQQAAWERIVYIDMSGQSGYVCPFPLYYRRGNETLQEIAERFLSVVELSNPSLATNAPVTWPSTRRLGVHAGTVLASLGWQMTELDDLLLNTLEWEKAGRFQEALRRYPLDAAPAVSYFRDTYLHLSRTNKLQLVSTLLDHVFSFTSDKNLRAVFAAAAPGITWETVAQQGLTVILDCQHVASKPRKRFALLWTFLSLYEFIKSRNRSDPPLGIIIDEFDAFAAEVTTGRNPLASLFDEFIQQDMRNSNIWLTVAHQSIQQVDQSLRQTLLSLGNYLFAQTPTIEDARILADAMFLRDPFWVKNYRRVSQSYSAEEMRSLPVEAYSEDPVFMPFPEQTELFAKRLFKLKKYHFLFRPAAGEGVISTDIYPVSIRNVDLDPVTGEYHYPDPDELKRQCRLLAAQSGIPVSEILREQEARLTPIPSRLTPGTHQIPHQSQSVAPSNGHQPVEPGIGRMPPPHSTLADDHRVLLTYLMDNPDSSVTDIYKHSGIRGAKLSQIREELMAKGLLAELDVRTGSATGGRPVKYLIPSVSAWELCQKEPPAGRGGAIHRHVQRMVVSGALAKGYSATIEQQLASGGIVDVELQKGAGVKIALEIAIASRPDRETAHYKECLAAGYEKVYGIFADDLLLDRTALLLAKEFSAIDARKVRLLPLSKLGQVG